MIWILIAVWFDNGTSSVAVEFNDKASCLAAAQLIQKQTHDLRGQVSVLCAAKGK